MLQDLRRSEEQKTHCIEDEHYSCFCVALFVS